jgi:ribonuclease Z
VLIEGCEARIGPWKANAFSVASRATWIVLPALDLVLDVGAAVDAMRSRHRLFLSHLHLDHAQGLPMWVGWRQQQEEPPLIWLHHLRVDEADALLRAAAAANGHRWRYTLQGLAEGDTVPLDGRHTLHVFETPHHVPTLGALICQRRRRLHEAHRASPPARVTPEMLEEHEVPVFCYTSDTTPELFDRRPDLLAAETLVTECSYVDGVLEYDPQDSSTLGERPEISHTHLRPLARRLAGFRGQHLVLGHFPASMLGTDFRALLLSRLPPYAAERLQVLPTAAPTAAHAVPPERPAALPPLLGETWPPGAWEIREHPGHFGWGKSKKLEELAQRYPGFRLAHLWRGELLVPEAALALYEEAYLRFFSRHPLVLDWLVQTAADVYDTEPANTASGVDYAAQSPSAANHLQDIAIRRAVWRLGRWFEGRQLLEVRGQRSAGYALNPGLVPFHEPAAIACGPLSSWVLPGSIEAFWQANKVVITPR